MSANSKSLSSYKYEEALWLSVLEHPQGVRLEPDPPTHAKCIHLRMRLNRYRQLVRENSLRTFPQDDHRHNVTPYDSFSVIITELDPEHFCIELRSASAIDVKVTPLKE